MCDPTAMLALRAAGTILSISQNIREQRAEQAGVYRQNLIAAQARREKENAENLRLRQIAERKKEKQFDLAVEAREKRATALTAAEGVSGGVLDRVLGNYYRLEGRYTSQIERNLQAEIAQSNINKRLFAHEQEARTQYIPEVDFIGAFATQAIEFGGDYMEWKARKDEKEAEEKRMNNMMVRIGVL